MDEMYIDGREHGVALKTVMNNKARVALLSSVTQTVSKEMERADRDAQDVRDSQYLLGFATGLTIGRP